uniref:Chemokine like factor n=2 Tax=Balaenoptera TaxID=9766 RepID=A0A8C0DL96_BALMU
MLTVKLKPKHRPFCFSVKGHVKMLRLDIINSVVTAVFMIVISVLALIPETTTYIVIGGVFGLVASVFCIADGALIYRKLLFNPSGPYQKSAVHDKLVL